MPQTVASATNASITGSSGVEGAVQTYPNGISGLTGRRAKLLHNCRLRRPLSAKGAADFMTLQTRAPRVTDKLWDSAREQIYLIELGDIRHLDRATGRRGPEHADDDHPEPRFSARMVFPPFAV